VPPRFPPAPLACFDPELLPELPKKLAVDPLELSTHELLQLRHRRRVRSRLELARPLAATKTACKGLRSSAEHRDRPSAHFQGCCLLLGELSDSMRDESPFRLMHWARNPDRQALEPCSRLLQGTRQHNGYVQSGRGLAAPGQVIPEAPTGVGG